MGFCEDNSENSVEQRRRDDFTAPGGTKIGCWGSCNPVDAPIQKAPLLAQVGRRTGNRPKPARGFGKQIVLRLSAGFCEEVSWLRTTEQTAGQAKGLPASFLELFSFRKRKKWYVPFLKRKSRKVTSVHKEKTFFLFIRFLNMKNLIFFIFKNRRNHMKTKK